MSTEGRNAFHDMLVAAVREHEAKVAKLAKMPHDDLARFAVWLIDELDRTQGRISKSRAKGGRPPAPTNAFARRKVGRPKDRKRDAWLKALLMRVVQICDRAQWRGRGAGTRVIDHELAAAAKASTISAARLRSMRKQWQKDLSEAKRLFPEITEKLPK